MLLLFEFINITFFTFLFILTFIYRPNLLFPELPYSAEYIKSHYTIQVVQNNTISRSNIYFEDDFHQSNTSNGMWLSLISNTFTLRTYEDGTYDVPVITSENTYNNRIMELIIAFIKVYNTYTYIYVYIIL